MENSKQNLIAEYKIQNRNLPLLPDRAKMSSGMLYDPKTIEMEKQSQV